VSEYLEANQANWNERVPIHVGSEFYDVAGWLHAKPGPRPREIEALGDVSGLDLVHLQCHFGLDTLAFARAGARVTGLDFSPPAVAEATRLAAEAGLEARFVEGNVLDAAAVLAPDTFDIVYVSLGALCWLPSVARWAEQVSLLLRPGGRLYIHDGHPLGWALADEDLRIEYSCFEEDSPYTDDDGVTYTDGSPLTEHKRHYEWNHSIGELITAVIRHGMRVDQFIEHDWTVFPRFPWLVEREHHIWAPPDGMPRVPLTFTLVASRLT
jgi:SAM-dependent methyltransferase